MGPLKSIRILEFAGIGALPMCGMLLADLGASVLRIERPYPSGLGIQRPARFNFVNRSRNSIVIDLKSEQGVALALMLVERADALLEGFRPGTMERLGLGPAVCLDRNSRLVYGRLSGWGQDGPLAQAAGHDLNYIALAGALHAIGRKGQPPTPPLNLVGDYGGGAMYLAVGVLCALIETTRSGQGQVVDASIVDGATSLMTAIYGLHAAGMHGEERGTNIGDSGAPYYDVYACADGRYVAIAALETKFRAELFRRLGIADEWVLRASRKECWQELRDILDQRFRTRTRDEWCTLLEGTDACFAPVLSMSEAPDHPQHRARATFIEVDGTLQPAPAPRFGRTPARRPSLPDQVPGENDEAVMQEWGFTPEQIRRFRTEGALGRPGEQSRVQDTGAARS